MFNKYAEHLLRKQAFFSFFEGHTNPMDAIKQEALGVVAPEYASKQKTLQELLAELAEKKKKLGLDKDKPDKEFTDPSNKVDVTPEAVDFSGTVARTELESKRRRDGEFRSSPPTQKSPHFSHL